MHGLKALNGDNNLTDFIGEYECNYNICDDLIEFYKQNKHGYRDGSTNGTVVDKNIKDSIDLPISCIDDKEPIQKYRDYLWDCVYKYADTYKELHRVNSFSLAPSMNIQHYKIGGGFKTWHCERSGDFNDTIKRILVFMTYLNDVDDGGTEFLYQNKIVKAEKGKTVIWPSDWTHTHRGQISHTKEKMIVTGWFSHLWDNNT